MKITSVQGGGLLGAGVHKVRIEKVFTTEARQNPLYKDRTPQLAVVFKAENNQQQTAWYNLVGYKKDANGDYMVDKNGARIQDIEATEGCMNILGKLAYACGSEAGESVDTDELIDKTCSITVKEEVAGKPFVAYVNRIAEEVTA